MVLIFTGYTYLNIFQQSLFQIQLPPIDAVELLRDYPTHKVSDDSNSVHYNIKDYINLYSIPDEPLLFPTFLITRYSIHLWYSMKQADSNISQISTIFQIEKIFKRKNPLDSYCLSSQYLTYPPSKVFYEDFIKSYVMPLLEINQTGPDPKSYNLHVTLKFQSIIDSIQVTIFFSGLVFISARIVLQLHYSKVIKCVVLISYIFILVLVIVNVGLTMTVVIEHKNPTLGCFNAGLQIGQLVLMLPLGYISKVYSSYGKKCNSAGLSNPRHLHIKDPIRHQELKKGFRDDDENTILYDNPFFDKSDIPASVQRRCNYIRQQIYENVEAHI